MPDSLQQHLSQLMNGEPVGCAHAPGRVNLIGEHTDYNLGYVLPMAIQQTADVYFARRDDNQVVCRSMEIDEQVTLNLADLSPEADIPVWAKYGIGPVWALLQSGHTLGGISLLIDSNVAMGGGLSSSAAMQVGVAGALKSLFDLKLDNWDLARLARRSENEFAGIPCGVMDPFASVFGRSGHALWLDCRSLEHEEVEIDFPDSCFLVANTGVKHTLGTSEYAKRQEQCSQAARQAGVETLRNLNQETLEKITGDAAPRARHVYSENLRVESAVNAMRRGDMEYFGELMYASHESLKMDYEVSCAELDVLVDTAMDVDGCYGARMTGGGFGGCIVALVDSNRTEQLIKKIGDVYQQTFGRTPECTVVTAGGGLTLDVDINIESVEGKK